MNKATYVCVGGRDFIFSSDVSQRLLIDTGIIYKSDTINGRVYIDRNPLWMPLIIDYARGYKIDFDIACAGASDAELGILRDDLAYYELNKCNVDASVLNSWKARIAHIMKDDNTRDYLELEDEITFAEAYACYSGDTEPTEDLVQRAEHAVRMAEFKEYFTSSSMRIISGALDYWKENTDVPVTSLKSSIEKRLASDDELMLQVYEFSDSLRRVPLISWAVDNVKMFIVHYFMQKRNA